MSWTVSGFRSMPWSRLAAEWNCKAWRRSFKSTRPATRFTPVRRISRSPDRDDLQLLTARPHDVPHRLADQRLRHRRGKRDRAILRVGLVLADDAIGLHAAVGAAEGHRAAERDDIRRGWIGDDLRRSNPLGEIP